MADLRTLLTEGRRPLLVELDPPRDTGPAAFVEGARKLTAAGADIITIADCPTGRASTDACMLAAKLKREEGIEPLPHMACRDRNWNAAKALLLGLDMEGVHQLLLVTGDPVAQEDRGQVKTVFQYNAAGLCERVRGLAAAGQIAEPFLCGALNVNAVNFDAELQKAQRKEEAGIRAFLTQPVSGETAARNLHIARERLRGYLLGGLYPPVSHRNALFLQKVNGMRLPDEMAAAYEGLNREEGEALGLEFGLRAARSVLDAVDGFYIVTPFRRVELVTRLMEGIRCLS